jgi:glycosyltransferase involved in cell wall biosynthesis
MARIAVTIPCFNEGGLVAEAARSVQEPEDVDVLVVDDGSDDGETADVLGAIEREGVRVVRHAANSGLIAARMTGLAETRAPFVFNLDADDLAIPGALSAMADRLDADPGAAACCGDYLEFGTHERLRAVPDELDPYRLAFTNEYPVSALWRRSVLDEVGGWRATGYDERAYEDWNLWVTLAERGFRIVHLGHGKPTFRHRFHGERMLVAARRDHPRLYRAIRSHHPELFASLPALRRDSSLGPARKLLYPLLYGGRGRFAFEPRVKLWLDRVGVWTLRR